MFKPILLAALSALLLLSSAAHAQSDDFNCVFEHDDKQNLVGGPSIAFQDSLRMLVVLVRFQDDDWSGSSQTSRNRWPDTVPPTILPDWAGTLLAPTAADVNASNMTAADSSLSAYFFNQSKNGPSGPHVLWGDNYPRNASGTPEVYVTQQPEAYYANNAGRGWGYLVQEVLDSLVTDPGFDIADYDTNGDDVVDHIAFVVRKSAVPTGEGVARLDAVAMGGGIVFGWPPGGDLTYWSPSRQSNVAVNRYESGSFQVVGSSPSRGLIAHEYAHQLFDMIHTSIIGSSSLPVQVGVTNDVPFLRPRYSDGRAMTGPCFWNRMCGTNGSVSGSAGPNDIRRSNYDGNSTLGAHELRRMGWADVTTLDPALGSLSGVTVDNLYESGDVVLIPLISGSAGDVLSIESRQRTNFFDTGELYDTNLPFYGQIRKGLKGSGLAISLTKGTPSGIASNYRYDMVPPDNMFGGFNQGVLRIDTPCDGTSPGCIGTDIYETDIYQPGTAAQITPWTRPNVSGYTFYPDGVAPNWFAVDDIRYTGGSGDQMAFDFVADVRSASLFIVTADSSWWGSETNGQTLNTIHVADGATLTVEAGVSVTLTDNLVVLAGGELVLEDGAVLSFAPGKRLIVYGHLDATGATLTASDPALGWGGLQFSDASGTLRANSRVELASGSINASIYALRSGITIDNSTVFGFSGGKLGVRAVGAPTSGQSYVWIKNGSFVQNHTNAGVVAVNGATVYVQNSNILDNEDGLSATNASIFTLESDITDHDDYGTRAHSFGNVVFGIPGFGWTDVNNLVTSNTGGDLRATSYGVISAGDQTSFRDNSIVRDDAGLHAFSKTNSDVTARYDWWGVPTGPDLAFVTTDATSTFDYCPFLTSQAGTGVGGPCVFGGGSKMSTSGTTRSGDAGDTPAERLAAAREALNRGDALDALDAAFDLATTSEDASVRDAAVVLIAHIGHRDIEAPVMDALAELSAPGGPQRVLATRATAALHVARGDTEAARTSAELLAVLSPEHAAAGHALSAFALLDGGETDLARAALALAEAQLALSADPEGDAELIEVAREEIAIRSGETSEARDIGAPQAKAGTTDRSTALTLGDPFPNPTRETVELALTLPGEGALSATVYDLLGRRVAVLADDAHVSEAHTLSVDARDLAPGLYVIRTTVRTATGTEALTRTFTVVK